jgi:hypothetical protein
MTNSGWNTILSGQERHWVDRSGDAHVGAWLVRDARALNGLSVAPLTDELASDVSDESQSVFDRMVGRERLIGYWQEKFETIRRSGRGLAAELARLPDGQPGVALDQAASDDDTNWLDTPLAVMTIRTNERGEANSFLMITCVPAPSSARGSGLFLGRTAAPTARPKRFVRASPDFDEMTLYVFYLDGTIELDRRMAEAVDLARRALPGIRVAEASFQTADHCPAWPVVHQFGFNGFPSVGALFRGEPIDRHQGLIAGPDLLAALREAAPMFVASSPGQDGHSDDR